MRACSQGIIVSIDQFKLNCFKRNIRSITPCFDALSYLCKYLLEIPELSRSIWVSFYPYAFYSFKGLCNEYLIYSTLIKYVEIKKDLSQLLRANSVRISESRHDRSNIITWKVQFMLTYLLFQNMIRRNVICVSYLLFRNLIRRNVMCVSFEQKWNDLLQHESKDSIPISYSWQLLGRRQANLCFHFGGSGENLPDIAKWCDATLDNELFGS